MAKETGLANKAKAVKRQKCIRNIVMIVLCVISLIPFYLMFVNATRTSNQVQGGLSLLFGTNLKNNIANFNQAQNGLGITVFKSMFNSFKVAVPFTLLSVYFSSATAYGIHNYEFKGKKAAWAFIMAVMMVPTQVFAIGFYQFMMKINLLDTYWPLIIPRSCDYDLANARDVYYLVTVYCRRCIARWSKGVSGYEAVVF